MKNFRKVLALVLVVATLFSFTAMASAANVAEYEDWDKVSYEEAVDVLSAVGILNGYEDDTFKPTATISREEMAKMIAVLANSGTDVSTLYASACTFADVPTSKWSASYVAYCAKTGIVAGRSATTFDPTGKVTGLETAKMLLVVLGFDADEQGYVGSDWKVNVLRDAKVMGLLNGFAAGYDPEAAITREEAAQMMLNALEAPAVVGILSNEKVTITNALIFGNKDKIETSAVSNWFDVVSYATLKDALAAGKWALYGNVVISDDILYTKLFPTLEKKSYEDRDCFGRPATVWTWTDSKGNKTTLAQNVAAPVWSSYNTDADEIAEQIAEYKKVATSWKYFSDGSSKSSATGFGGKGVLVEVYYIDGEITVVEIHTYIGTIDQLNTAKKTFKLGNYTVSNTYGYTVDDEGTDVLYWVCKDGVHTVADIEGKTLTVHGTRVVADYFCDKAGNKYEYSEDFTGTKLGVDQLGTEVTIVTDKYGYVLAWAPVTDSAKVAVLVAGTATKTINSVTNYKENATYAAQFVDFEDGAAPESYVVDSAAFETDKAGLDHDLLVTYYEGTNDARVKTKAANEAPNGTYTLNEGSGVITGLNVAAGNNDTQYLLRVYNWMTGEYEYKYFDGKDEIDATYALTELQYITTSYNYNANKTYLAYVYAEATYTVKSTMAFVLGYYTDESYITEGGEKLTYHLHKAIVNGEEAYVAYQMKLDDKNIMYFGSYELINAESHDGLPIYIATSKMTESMGKNYWIEAGTLQWYDEAGNLQSKDIATDATIVIVTNVKGTVTVDRDASQDDVVEIAEYHGWENTYSWYSASGNKVSSLFVYVESN